MPKKQAVENSKKAAGMAKKAENAAAKQAVKDKVVAAAESAKWEQGAKDNKKAEAAASKAAEAARKKAERDALLKEEEASQPSKPKGAGTKTAQKKNTRAATSGGIDGALASLDRPAAGPSSNAILNASGIDNALDALSLTSGTQDKIDRHPERRFPAAYKAFEERRLDEMKDEKGLRRQQKIDLIRKEFEKHPDNPFNQVNASYNTSKAEMQDIREAERKKLESRLGSP